MPGSTASKRLRIHVLIVLVAMIVGSLAGLVVALVSPQQYTARADVFVTAAPGASPSEAAATATYTQDEATSLAELAHREIVLGPVIETLGLKTSISGLAAHVKTTVPLDTTIISIVVSDSSATQAAAIANAISAKLAIAVHKITTPDSPDTEAPVSVKSIQQATAPSSASSPRTTLDIAIGLLAGLFVGVAVLVLLDALTSGDAGVRGRTDIDGLDAAQRP